MLVQYSRRDDLAPFFSKMRFYRFQTSARRIFTEMLKAFSKRMLPKLPLPASQIRSLSQGAQAVGTCGWRWTVFGPANLDIFSVNL